MNTEQAPINTEFGFNSTALQVIEGCDLRGKTAIVTGGHSGIGLETTRALASAGATVVVGARKLEKAKQNVAGIKNVEVYALDLASPASIDAFTAQFMQSNRALDILINNAGILARRKYATAAATMSNSPPTTLVTFNWWQMFGPPSRSQAMRASWRYPPSAT